MSTPTDDKSAKPQLQWYQHLWLALPFALVFLGGALGGCFGGMAWGINQKLFQKIEHPVLRYIYTGLISLAAVVAYLVVATWVFTMLKKHR